MKTALLATLALGLTAGFALAKDEKYERPITVPTAHGAETQLNVNTSTGWGYFTKDSSDNPVFVPQNGSDAGETDSDTTDD